MGYIHTVGKPYTDKETIKYLKKSRSLRKLRLT